MGPCRECTALWIGGHVNFRDSLGPAGEGTLPILGRLEVAVRLLRLVIR